MGLPSCSTARSATSPTPWKRSPRHISTKRGFDAITVNPYLGSESLAPLFARAGKGLFLLCKNSNPGSGEIQNMELTNGRPLFAEIAARVVDWNETSEAALGLVAGATFPAELIAIREIAPDLLILVPGIGSQAGDLAAALDAGMNADGAGLLINSSRSITYASSDKDFARSRQSRPHVARSNQRDPGIALSSSRPEGPFVARNSSSILSHRTQGTDLCRVIEWSSIADFPRDHVPGCWFGALVVGLDLGVG